MITHVHCDIHGIPARIGKEKKAAGCIPMESNTNRKGIHAEMYGTQCITEPVMIIYTGNIKGT